MTSSKTVRVKALKLGFHDGAMRQPGAEFLVPEGTKASWFKPVEEVTPADLPKPEPVGDEPTTLSAIRTNAKSFNQAVQKK